VSDPTKNNQTSTEYLLGALPEAETERLDELSITDDEFTESLQVAETDLVDAYVLGEGGVCESPSKFWRAGVGWFFC
jgi:hypothetical protein